MEFHSGQVIQVILVVYILQNCVRHISVRCENLIWDPIGALFVNGAWIIMLCRTNK